MSKIGRMPVPIPSGVTVSVSAGSVTVKGGKGELQFTIPRGISVKLENDILVCSRSNDTKPIRALHGTVRSVLANMVTGVSAGYAKKLELVGTGYRARMQGNLLILSLGFSHEIEYTAPTGITISVEGTNLITVSGFDKQLVGEVSAKIREYRKPEPYKGKGVRYQGEVVRKKAGKAGKAAA